MEKRPQGRRTRRPEKRAHELDARACGENAHRCASNRRCADLNPQLRDLAAEVDYTRAVLNADGTPRQAAQGEQPQQPQTPVDAPQPESIEQPSGHGS